MPLFFSCFLVSCSAFQYRSRFLRYFIKYPTSKMTPHRLILLVVLSLCSAISFVPALSYFGAIAVGIAVGLQAFYNLELSKLPPGSFNGNVVIFYFKQNVSIICNGKSEVERIIDTTDQTNSSVQVVTPSEKILRIRNVTGYDTGAYTCISKNNPEVFWKFFVHVFGDRPGTEIIGEVESTYKYERYISLEKR